MAKSDRIVDGKTNLRVSNKKLNAAISLANMGPEEGFVQQMIDPI